MELYGYELQREKDLSHHGILGQKWGKQNGPPYPLDVKDHSASEKKAGWRKSLDESSANPNEGKFQLSDKQKKYIKIGATAVAASLAICGGVYLYTYKQLNPSYLGHYKRISGELLENYINKFPDDNGVSYKEGTIFKRVSSDANADCIKRGATYVSKLFGDKMKYASRLPGESWNRGSQMYVHSLKSNTEIKAPSSREAAKLFLHAYPDATQSTFINYITYNIRNTDTKTDKFIQELKKHGYNALIDENDYGWTKAPIILIDPSETIASTSSRKMRKIEEVIATILQ